MLLFLLALFSANSSAQTAPAKSAEPPNPFSLAGAYLKQNNYITPLLELRAQEAKYLASPVWKGAYLEMMTLLEGYVGNYDAAYRYENLLYETFPSSKQIKEQYGNELADLKSSPVADYKMADALEALDAAAADRRVVMINEEHRTPFHRALTFQMLSRLYEKGFRYFAAETLTSGDLPDAPEDAKLNKRGYPVQGTGFYTADPIYADVVRAALRLGYKVVPYESVDPDCKSPKNNPEYCNDRRERGQAQNLVDRILMTDPEAKILVHVGRGHNSKAPVSKEFNFMAYYFRQLSGIDPFTIDQLRFSERRDPAYEQPLYRFLTKNDLLKKPSVFQAENGKFYVQSAGYDALVFHPRMKYAGGRATFLRSMLGRKTESIDLKKLNLKAPDKVFAGDEPVLIQAFYADENADAVPIDQFILHPNQIVPSLMLPEGKFRVRTMDKKGKILRQYETKEAK
ncbi:MAG TPA: hypothetical protein VIL74_04470 [Pyrinomonadaceae bacterium]